MDNKSLGSKGEALAAQYLTEHGFLVQERNYRIRFGEIDIIATKSGVLYCVEVKTRSSIRYGLPSEALTKKKMERMRVLAELYAQHIQFNGQLKLALVEVLNGVCTFLEIE